MENKLADKQNNPEIKTEIPSGFILIDKPEKITSHTVINRLRRITGIRKIGHAGTLDPMATGLLIVAVGRQATKKIGQFIKLDKTYEAEFFFGRETDTHDREGKIISEYSGPAIKKETLKKSLESFIGPQEQLPPMFSAKKVKGKKLYELARRDIEIERPKSNINIYSIVLKSFKWPKAKAIIACSSGTYIRVIAKDLGLKLGCGAHLSELRRTKIANFSIAKSIELDKMNEANWEKFLISEPKIKN